MGSSPEFSARHRPFLYFMPLEPATAHGIASSRSKAVSNIYFSTHLLTPSLLKWLYVPGPQRADLPQRIPHPSWEESRQGSRQGEHEAAGAKMMRGGSCQLPRDMLPSKGAPETRCSDTKACWQIDTKNWAWGPVFVGRFLVIFSTNFSPTETDILVYELAHAMT